MTRLALLSLVLACAASARADALVRGLISPSREQPSALHAGERLQMTVRVASGLTPPPGVQTERALRGFVARACSERATSTTGEPERCTRLTVRNVRPTDAHSLIYRVEAPLPRDLPAGLYHLELRFPGGVSRAPHALRVAAPPQAITSAEPSAGRATEGCAASGAPFGGSALGLLLLAISRKLRASRPPRTRVE